MVLSDPERKAGGSPNAILVAATRTNVDKGDGASRFFIGMGAGRERVAAQLDIQGPDGKSLGRFERGFVALVCSHRLPLSCHNAKLPASYSSPLHCAGPGGTDMAIPVQHAQVDRPTDYFLNDHPNAILTIGRFSYIDGRALVYFYKEISTVRIGTFCAIANNVSFFLRANHHVEWVTTYPIDLMPWPDEVPKPEEAHAKLDGDIIIGNDVWIGEGARFLPGVTVGDGAVIGAATVVTKDVPAYSLFAGNPGAVRKMRFADADIEFLLRLQWWNWPTEKIRRFAPLICSPRIEALREKTEIQGGEGGRTPTLE